MLWYEAMNSGRKEQTNRGKMGLKKKEKKKKKWESKKSPIKTCTNSHDFQTKNEQQRRTPNTIPISSNPQSFFVLIALIFQEQIEMELKRWRTRNKAKKFLFCFFGFWRKWKK